MTNYEMDEIERQRDREKLAESIRDKRHKEQKNIYHDYQKLRMDKKNDRFDLEESIMEIWHTEDDLDTVLYNIIDSPRGPLTQDEVVNLISGVKDIHNARMRKLWDVFENFVHTEYTYRINSENIPHDAVTPTPPLD